MSTAIPDQKPDALLPLTSLRFLAALMIVIHHAPNYFSWAWASAVPASSVHGVSFFFVLSGFILTHVYTSKPLPGYGRFLGARFARLWPIHLFSLLMLITFVRPDSITFDGPGLFDKRVVLAANLSLLHAAVPMTAYQFSWNAVSWSISTEAFFYLAFPLLLIRIEKTWHWKLLGAAVLAAGVFVLGHLAKLPMTSGIEELNIASLTYTNPLVRGFEFCLGMAAWVIWKKYIRDLKLSALTWTALECAALIATGLWLVYGYYAVTKHIHSLPVLLALERAGSCWILAILIIILAAGRGAVGKALSIRPLVFLGEISFSVYMIHQVLMKIMAGWMPKDFVTATSYFGALLFLSAASYVLIEKPCQKRILAMMPAAKRSRDNGIAQPAPQN